MAVIRVCDVCGGTIPDSSRGTLGLSRWTPDNGYLPVRRFDDLCDQCVVTIDALLGSLKENGGKA